MKVEATPEQDAMVQAFARAIEAAGGKALLVGGLVRDEILGLPSKDFDFEVFGLPMEKVQAILSRFGNVKEVGQQFGVLNIQELDWDVALPRREQKIGEGHKGFDVVPDPTMSIEDAARRRDLTINALSKDPLTGEILDPLNGMADLKAGILRMADPNTFGDDPLRALRVAQFAARFDFDVDPETLKVVAAQPLEQLPGERILPEFSKMLLKGQKPSKGIEVLHQANLLRYFPEIEALQGVPQEPKWHPEGDVYVHTLLVLDEAAKQRTGDPAFDLPLMLGALAHDFGKPATTTQGGVLWKAENENAKRMLDEAIKESMPISSCGHEAAGIEPTRAFLGRMKAPLALTKQVETLVDTHLRPAMLPGTGGRKGYRKLGRTLSDAGVSPELLAALSKADVLGRTTEEALRRDVSSQDKFLEDYHQHVTSVSAPGGKLVDSVSGRHLIARGFKPGPDMGKFLALTRSIEDETAITDPDKLIELATRFLKDRSEGGGSQEEGENQCGDSHIRPGEECFDGNYREERKKGNTKSMTADFFDWTIGRPCEDGDEKYPDKCTGPGSSAENPYGPHDNIPDTQWELPPADTTPYAPDEELALPPELEEPAPQAQEPNTQLGPDAWELPFSDEELNNPKQNAADQKMLKQTEKDFAKKQNDADKAMLKKTQEDQKAQKLADKEHAQRFKQEEQEYNKYLAQGPKSQVPQGMDFKEWLQYIVLGPDSDKATGKGPSEFRTNPDKTQPDFLLWEQFEMPADQKGKSLHPGLASVALAEPQRRHKRAQEYPGVKDFDRGSRFSNHPLEGPLGRDGFGGSTPRQMEELDPSPNGMTPETGIFPNWEGDPAEAYETPNDKDRGFLPVELPFPEMPETSTPHPSPTRGAEDSPPSSFPGQIVRKPGGGGLDRAPMIKPRGADQETGFLPVQNYPDPERNMFKACAQEDADKATSTLDPTDVHGPGGQNPGGDDMNHGERGRGGRGGGTKIRPYWDMDFTGKKSGFMSIEEPKENIYPAATEAARTMEDLMDIDAIFPKEYSPSLEEERPGIGPSMNHRNEREVPIDPIQASPATFTGPDLGMGMRALEVHDAVEADDDANVEQKQVQPLMPNQKMAIAVDPKGPMGERIVIMSPLFEEASPAIMALRSHRFERHGGIVIDGPPEWLLGITPRLEALDKSSGNDGADDLFARVQQLIQSAGMPIEYEQQPRP